MKCRSFLWFLVTLPLPAAGQAQETYGIPHQQAILSDSVRSPQNFASVGFDKLVNTYHWTGRASYRNRFGPDSLQLNEQFLSSLIQTDRKLITDEQSLDLAVQHRLLPLLQGAIRFSSFSLSDNKNIGISNASSQGLYGGIVYQPDARIRVEPLVGARFDHQIDERDRGPSYLLDLNSDVLDYNGYMTTLNGKWEYDRLTPRTLETRNASVGVDKVFFEQTQNSLQFLYSRNRRDFYTAADPFVQQQNNVPYNIETRTEDAFTMFDSLAYGLGPATLLSLQGNLFTRTIGRDTRYRQTADPERPLLNTSINELKLESSAQIAYSPRENFRASLRFSYQERDEKHEVQPDDAGSALNFDTQDRIEKLKNNHSRRTSIASSLSAPVSASDTIALSGSGSLLRYDTPSTENNDDRDELWYIINLAASHRINRYLTLRLLAGANLIHLVYLPSATSGNNTWNRVLRLSPRVEYTPSDDITTLNTFEVLANYTVYDFEYPSSPVRSFAFRQFAFIDSSSWKLTQRLTLEWFNNIKLYERGELQWDSFSERPVNYFEDKTYAGTVRYAMLPRSLLFSIGIRYFSQRRYAYSGQERNLEDFFRSLGPTTSVSWLLHERTALTVQGWYEHQTQTGLPDHSIANVTMSLILTM